MIGFVLAALAATMLAAPVAAQTPFQGQGGVPLSPPGKAQPGAPSTGSTASQTTKPPGGAITRPPGAVGAANAQQSATAAAGSQSNASTRIPEDMRQQAEFQRDGAFPEMTRPGAGGQIQDAWDKAEPKAGVYVQKLCSDCVYKVRTREFMITTVVLPEDAVITTIDPGDHSGAFVVQKKSKNKLTIRPTAWGQDTNLNVNTRSGAVYPLYVRSETVNSVNIPDLVYRIAGQEKPVAIDGAETDGPGAKDGTPPLPPQKPAKKDFVRHKPLDVSKFHGWDDYRLSGDDELKPETIWRDDVWTYIRYGDKWDGMELSTGYVTNDGFDELVNSHVEGTVFVIEAISPLITLKNGKKYLCIQYTGSKP